METGAIIKELRIKKGLTQEELGKILGVQKAAIQKYESGLVENIKRSSIIKMAQIFDVTPAYIMGWTDDPQGVPLSNVSFETVVAFPEIGVIRAGYGGVAVEEKTGRTIEIPSSMLNGHKKSDYFCLRVSGNSMYPKLIDGDTILCLRAESVDSGSLAVVLYNGDEATVKKVVYKEGEDWLELIPANPEYQPKRIEGEDLNQCRILGKVVKLIRDL